MTAELFDEVLTKYKGGEQLLFNAVYNSFNNKYNENILAAVFDKLYQDGYLKMESQGSHTKHSVYSITIPGLRLLENGGFKQKEEDERKEKEFIAEKKRLEVEQLQSVIATNNNVKETNKSIKHLNEVVLPANLKSQKIFGRWSLILAAFSGTFIGVSAFLQWTDKVPSKLQDLKIQAEETKKSLNNIESSLQEINSSMKKMSDSVLVRLKK